MFDTTLIASNPRREVGRRLATLPAAIVVHAVVLALAMAAQLLAVAEVPEPVTTVAFVDFQVPEPPAAPPARHGDRGSTPKPPEPAVPPPPEVQPTVIPSEPAHAGDPVVRPEDPGIPGGDPDSKGGTIPYGVPAELPPRTVAPPEVDSIYNVEAVTTPPVPVQRVLPAYPEAARHVRVQGTVVIRAVIDRFGNVVDPQVVRSLPLGCDEAALSAMRGWRYEPATLNGRPVSVELTVSFTFRLNAPM